MMEERHRVPIKLLLDEFLNVHVVLRRLYVEPNQNLCQDVRCLGNLLKEDELHRLHHLWRPCPIVQEHIDQNVKSIQETLALVNGQEDLLYSPKTEQLSDSFLPVRFYHVSQSLDHVSEVPNLRELITAWIFWHLRRLWASVDQEFEHLVIPVIDSKLKRKAFALDSSVLSEGDLGLPLNWVALRERIAKMQIFTRSRQEQLLDGALIVLANHHQNWVPAVWVLPDFWFRLKRYRLPVLRIQAQMGHVFDERRLLSKYCWLVKSHQRYHRGSCFNMVVINNFHQNLLVALNAGSDEVLLKFHLVVERRYILRLESRELVHRLRLCVIELSWLLGESVTVELRVLSKLGLAELPAIPGRSFGRCVTAFFRSPFGSSGIIICLVLRQLFCSFGLLWCTSAHF